MVKLSSYRYIASKPYPTKAVSPVKTPALPVQAAKPMLARELKTFGPISQDGEVMVNPLIGVERLTQE